MEKLTEKEIAEKLPNLKGWEHKDGCIQKNYTFKNFKQAFAFMTRVAFECEAQNHHPDWENVYNSVSIKLNTHDAGGVTQKDFDLAKTIQDLA
ncbi:4a-hydroxytetrahydrobiopterin dehydratase [Croceivirga radicis]|uniref:Putative pterin-4-alpha-carbinolamine dehydratase n=1 Tax=Croceivirga radicis TaxID=1929488 RepID=A0A1V6LR84_9FLAO|nr:4a-hydroxytetrahydrobiopterin dehydratase [Croceivirga radicis]OQD42694.1 4a-hydroxytetrahydrobiopterin dehydratase [Croceivirga radicis]